MKKYAMKIQSPRLLLRWLRPDDLDDFLAYRSVMFFGHHHDKGEAQSAPPLVMAVRILCPLKRIENSLLILAAYAFSLIAYAAFDLALIDIQREFNGGAGRAVADRILQQIGQRSFEQSRVSFQPGFVHLNGANQADLPAARLGKGFIDRVVGDADKIGLVKSGLIRIFRPGQLQKTVGQTQRLARIVLHTPRHLLVGK